MPLVSLSFQSSATMPSSTRRVTSGSSERWTSSASWPAIDGAALVAGGAVGLLELDVLAGVGVLEGRDDARVGLLQHGVAHEVERVGVGAGAGG